MQWPLIRSRFLPYCLMLSEQPRKAAKAMWKFKQCQSDEYLIEVAKSFEMQRSLAFLYFSRDFLRSFFSLVLFLVSLWLLLRPLLCTGWLMCRCDILTYRLVHWALWWHFVHHLNAFLSLSLTCSLSRGRLQLQHGIPTALIWGPRWAMWWMHVMLSIHIIQSMISSLAV